MRASRIAMRCWPDLEALWRGRWDGLLWAVGFAAALDLALAASFLWPDSWGLIGQLVAWCLPVGIWGLHGIRSRPAARRAKAEPCPVDAELEGLFLQAQAEYLRGQWYEAETLLKRLLRKEPEDAEARLLLASVSRRAGRLQRARRQLRRVRANSEKWHFEVEREMARLTQLAGSAQSASQEQPGSDSGEQEQGGGYPPSAAA